MTAALGTQAKIAEVATEILDRADPPSAARSIQSPGRHRAPSTRRRRRHTTDWAQNRRCMRAGLSRSFTCGQPTAPCVTMARRTRRRLAILDEIRDGIRGEGWPCFILAGLTSCGAGRTLRVPRRLPNRARPLPATRGTGLSWPDALAPVTGG